jgi:hypothetical protein
MGCGAGFGVSRRGVRLSFAALARLAGIRLPVCGVGFFSSWLLLNFLAERPGGGETARSIEVGEA